MQTFANVEQGLDLLIQRNPWNAPGSAPVYSGCGIAGGNPFGIEGCEGDPTDFCTWGGYAYGPDARHWTGLKEAVTTGCRIFNP